MASMQNVKHTIGKNNRLRQGFDAGCCVLAGGDFV
jgi:hypothetical protein